MMIDAMNTFLSRLPWHSRLWWAMVFVMLTDVSYFVRSDGENLFGNGGADGIQAIGFPLIAWQRGGFAGTTSLHLHGLLADSFVGACLCWRGPHLWSGSFNGVDALAGESNKVGGNQIGEIDSRSP
jgi:hypothetical protein